MKNILLVGQTPPPYGGQSMSLSRVITHSFNSCKIYHIRMSFSKNFKQIGKLNYGKIFHLFKIILTTIHYRFKYDIKTLYYPPSGPSFFPIIRDIVFLIFVRPFFSEIIFHFHAAGVSEYISHSNKLLQFFAKLAYNKPSISIQLSKRNPADGKYFASKKIFILSNGLEDEYKMRKYHKYNKRPDDPINILYVAVIQKSKGIEVLIEATSLLQDSKIDFRVNIIGEFNSIGYEKMIKNIVHGKNLSEKILFHGIKVENEKFDIYNKSDIFCFPTFFESESFGNVVVEAMMFKLPVVATYWRGIPDIVENNKTGFLVNIQSPLELAEKLRILLDNHELRVKMGIKGREKYLSHYQIKENYLLLESIFNVNKN